MILFEFVLQYIFQTTHTKKNNSNVSQFFTNLNNIKIALSDDSKSKVMRCSRYGNGDRMHVILNGEPLEEVDCFKYLGSQVAADGGYERDVVHRMNEGYRAWGALKCPEQ